MNAPCSMSQWSIIHICMVHMEDWVYVAMLYYEAENAQLMLDTVYLESSWLTGLCYLFFITVFFIIILLGLSRCSRLESFLAYTNAYFKFGVVSFHICSHGVFVSIVLMSAWSDTFLHKCLSTIYSLAISNVNWTIPVMPFNIIWLYM